jgi:M-phase phosphoprotein 9
MIFYFNFSSRVSLREKHAKHMADLREYYEKELRDLKSSLLLEITDESPFKQVSNENQNLVIENRLLREKIEDLENDLTGFNRYIISLVC